MEYKNYIPFIIAILVGIIVLPIMIQQHNTIDSQAGAVCDNYKEGDCYTQHSDVVSINLVTINESLNQSTNAHLLTPTSDPTCTTVDSSKCPTIINATNRITVNSANYSWNATNNGLNAGTVSYNNTRVNVTYWAYDTANENVSNWGLWTAVLTIVVIAVLVGFVFAYFKGKK